MNTVLKEAIPVKRKVDAVRRFSLKVLVKTSEKDKRIAGRIIENLPERLDLARASGRSTIDVLWLVSNFQDLETRPNLSPAERLVFAHLQQAKLKPRIEVVYTGRVAGRFEGYHVLRANL